MGDKHTPTRLKAFDKEDSIVIRAPRINVAQCLYGGAYWPDKKSAEDWAALIVRAVNCHEELVEALQNCRSLVHLKFGNTDPTANAAIEQADTILAKVKDEGHG